MGHITEEAIAGNLTSEVTPQQVLQKKHDDFLLHLKALTEAYGCNILFAVNYDKEKQTAIDYIGEDSIIIENGLRYLFTRGN